MLSMALDLHREGDRWWSVSRVNRSAWDRIKSAVPFLTYSKHAGDMSAIAVTTFFIADTARVETTSRETRETKLALPQYNAAFLHPPSWEACMSYTWVAVIDACSPITGLS